MLLLRCPLTQLLSASVDFDVTVGRNGLECQQQRFIGTLNVTNKAFRELPPGLRTAEAVHQIVVAQVEAVRILAHMRNDILENELDA